MFIYVVEGPAGSGKSTMVRKQQIDWPGALFIEGRTGNRRTYAGDVGLAQSVMKDMKVLGAVLTCQSDLVILDRWLISSLVYDALRGEAPMPTQEYFDALMSSWCSMISGLNESLYLRGRLLMSKLQINWKFNIPAPVEIEQRRSQTGREYPYRADAEYMMYKMVERLMNNYIETAYPLPDEMEITMQEVSKERWEW